MLKKLQKQNYVKSITKNIIKNVNHLTRIEKTGILIVRGDLREKKDL